MAFLLVCLDLDFSLKMVYNTRKLYQTKPLSSSLLASTEATKKRYRMTLENWIAFALVVFVPLLMAMYVRYRKGKLVWVNRFLCHWPEYKRQSISWLKEAFWPDDEDTKMRKSRRSHEEWEARQRKAHLQ